MKTKIFLSRSLVCALVTVAASCTTTGDPRSGGIFWSPSKAQARLNNLRAQENESLQACTSEENRTVTLNRQIASLKAQIAEKKKKLQQSTTPTEIAALQNEISALESRLCSLTSI